MNQDPFRLRQNQQAGQNQETNLQPTQSKTFASAEELIRHDAAQTEVPLRVEERLNESLAAEKAPKSSWWRRWFNAE
jgi:hypothetical protein